MICNLKRWPMESERTNLRPAPKHDGLCEETLDRLELAEDAYGLLLERGPIVRPVSVVFSGMAYLRRLAGHRIRVHREMKKQLDFESAERRKGCLDSYRTATIKRPPLPGGMSHLDLKIVNCAGCGKRLLGESQEVLRIAAREAGSRLAKNFPPPVAARMHGGRPYCSECS